MHPLLIVIFAAAISALAVEDETRRAGSPSATPDNYAAFVHIDGLNAVRNSKANETAWEEVGSRLGRLMSRVMVEADRANQLKALDGEAARSLRDHPSDCAFIGVYIDQGVINSTHKKVREVEFLGTGQAAVESLLGRYVPGVPTLKGPNPADNAPSGWTFDREESEFLCLRLVGNELREARIPYPVMVADLKEAAAQANTVCYARAAVANERAARNALSLMRLADPKTEKAELEARQVIPAAPALPPAIARLVSPQSSQGEGRGGAWEGMAGEGRSGHGDQAGSPTGGPTTGNAGASGAEPAGSSTTGGSTTGGSTTGGNSDGQSHGSENGSGEGSSTILP